MLNPKCLLLFVLLSTIYFHNSVESAGNSAVSVTTQLFPEKSADNAVLAFLQSEATSLSLLQHNVRFFLHEKRIPIGLPPKSFRSKAGTHEFNDNTLKLRVALSTDNNYIPCRISLDKASVGSKCVAPCGCTGSSKWIKFSELNRLRRKEPSQWRFCQMCQQKFDYSGLVLHGGVSGNIVSAVLDNNKMLRIALFTGMALLGYILSFGNLILRFLMSRFFWQAYPRWSRIVHLPLLLKFWGGKIVFQYIFEQYLVIEDVIVDNLIQVETDMIEQNLPITVELEADDRVKKVDNVDSI